MPVNKKKVPKDPTPAPATEENQKALEIVAKAEGIGFKIPAKAGDIVDLLYKLKSERGGIQKKADAIEEKEALLKAYLIETLPVSNLEGVMGKTATARIIQSTVPTAENWDEIQKHVVRTKDFAILQRRLNNKYITDLWEAGKGIAGVGKYMTKSVSLTKR